MKTEERNRGPKEKILNTEENSEKKNKTPIEKNGKKSEEGWKENEDITAEDSEFENRDERQESEEEEERKLKPGKMKPVAEDTKNPYKKEGNEFSKSEKEKVKATETAEVELE